MTVHPPLRLCLFDAAHPLACNDCDGTSKLMFCPSAFDGAVVSVRLARPSGTAGVRETQASIISLLNASTPHGSCWPIHG